ncbi:hypothetical protein SYYSPA8_28185 [Streptomyces yaizuensis]|uniref:Uncharacterized protein n=1 Tax=Streptomyces yaizuensis TaxID=2989713 RepID=A0ABQ5P7P9_9ACTN|nr:hypothetical protein SYYSPA8_28185 [Streptomyces sp. YSPA8]
MAKEDAAKDGALTDEEREDLGGMPIEDPPADEEDGS